MEEKEEEEGDTHTPLPPLPGFARQFFSNLLNIIIPPHQSTDLSLYQWGTPVWRVSFLHTDFFFRVSSYYIVNSVWWSHALVNGPTSKSLGEMTTASTRPPLEIRRTLLSKLMSPHNHRTDRPRYTPSSGRAVISTVENQGLSVLQNSMPRVSPTPNSKSYVSSPIPMV